MKSIHYAVVLDTMNCNKDSYFLPKLPEYYIVYETLEEVLEKFPIFTTTLKPQWDKEETYLIGNQYNRILVKQIELTYRDISDWRPTEKELHDFLLKKQIEEKEKTRTRWASYLKRG